MVALEKCTGTHRNFSSATLREILLVVLTKSLQLYIFSKRYQKFCKTYQYLKVDGTKYTTNFFCKIDQIQVVWEMRIFYYCMLCLRATSKQKKRSYDSTLSYDCLFVSTCHDTQKAAQFFVSGVKNEQRSRGIGEQGCL